MTSQAPPLPQDWCNSTENKKQLGLAQKFMQLQICRVVSKTVSATPLESNAVTLTSMFLAAFFVPFSKVADEIVTYRSFII